MITKSFFFFSLLKIVLLPCESVAHTRTLSSLYSKRSKQSTMTVSSESLVQVEGSTGIIHNTEEPHNEFFDAEEQGRECWWRFSEFGEIGELSRDGSIHATDEVFNGASHLAAAFMSVLATVLLITESSARGEPWKIVSFSIYGASLIFLFSSSTLHHSITTTKKWEEFFQMLDYLAIFPLIAGTFTPLCLVFFNNSTIGWSFFSVVWSLSFISMYATARWFHKIPKWLTMTMYITLGWLGAFMIYWLLPVMGFGGLFLMLFGGVVYSVGGIVYSTEQPNPFPGIFGFHEIWHVAVILGAATHFVMMYAYVLPWERPV